MFGKIKDFLRSHTQFGKTRYLNFLYRYDQTRYFAHSGMDKQDAETLAAEMRLLVHALEKGLSVEHPKHGFGKEKVLRLLTLLEKYESSPQNPDPQAVVSAKAVIGNYAQYKLSHGEDVSFIPEKLILSNSISGVQLFKRNPSIDFASVAINRHSLRTFGSIPISKDSIENAVKLAQTAPSACNRQSTHVFACLNADKITMIKQRHGGLSGFSNLNSLLVVTGNLRLYQNEYERNTVFVDCGIFLMNLLYSLDAHNIASCPIIWGAEPDNDRFLYDLLDIPESHEIISLIAIGSFPERDVLVPRSLKRDTETILHFCD